MVYLIANVNRPKFKKRNLAFVMMLSRQGARVIGEITGLGKPVI